MEREKFLEQEKQDLERRTEEVIENEREVEEREEEIAVAENDLLKKEEVVKRFWPLLLLVLAIFISSSTVIYSRQWVQMVTTVWPGGMTDESL